MKAGYTCKTIGGSRGYAGTPFSTGRDKDDCYYLTGGAKSDCNGNRYGHHRALCYCNCKYLHSNILRLYLEHKYLQQYLSICSYSLNYRLNFEMKNQKKKDEPKYT